MFLYTRNAKKVFYFISFQFVFKIPPQLLGLLPSATRRGGHGQIYKAEDYDWALAILSGNRVWTTVPCEFHASAAVWSIAYIVPCN